MGFVSKYQKQTAIFLLFIAIILITWEGYALYVGGESTISEIIWKLCNTVQFVFAVGFLMGHFMWQSAVVYAHARGDVDYVKKHGLEAYHELRKIGQSEEESRSEVIWKG